MDETASYPPIEPSNFDLIVVGTGLPESILAAAASAAGKSVLHLGPHPSYGSHYASFPLHEFISYIQSQSFSEPSIPQPDTDSGFTRVPLTTRPLYSSVEITSYSSEPLEQSRKFNIDLSGPRVLFCADAMINLILKLEVNQYMEFKSTDESFFYDGEGNLENVPDSRSAIFMDRKLSFTEKTLLMGFFKLVQGHFEAAAAADGGETKSISEEDLETPFVEFLSKTGLSSKLKSYRSNRLCDAAADGGETKSISEEDLGTPFVEFLSKMGLSSKLKSYRSNRLCLSFSHSFLFSVNSFFFSLSLSFEYVVCLFHESNSPNQILSY